MSNQQVQRVKVKRLAHVGLWTADVPMQARFYRQVLGLDLRLSSDNAQEQDIELEEANAFLSLGEEMHSLALFNDIRPTTSNGRRPVVRTQLHHISLEVDTDAELAALAARLKMSGVDLRLEPRDGDPDLGDTLWFSDPDGNRIEISVTPDSIQLAGTKKASTRGGQFRPSALQHIAFYTMRLEEMVEFYTEALGFDISDWLLRESVWLRCNSNHHTIMFSQGKPGIDHIGFTIADGGALLKWADYLSHSQTAILWGPGRHGAGNDLFLCFSDADGMRIELSAELQQYYDRDVTTPPRLWHTKTMALNLWGTMPSWIKEEIGV